MKKLHIWVVLWILIVGYSAYGQPTNVPLGEIILDIPNTYITTYRDGSWVPVDVFVGNNKEDVTGYVEVQCEGHSGAQSPVYRAPAESPKGSVKRFRVYCRFEGTVQIKARLCTSKGYQVGPSFPLRSLTPVQEGVLCVVLDDETSDFGYLREAIGFGGVDERLYRIGLGTKELAFLPEMPQCYDSYDVIVAGNIDPTRVSPTQRDLIVDFVSRGGTLVISTGGNTAALRGTWLEELSGTHFGSEEATTEGKAGRMFFGGQDVNGLRDEWPVSLTSLTPNLPGVQTFGDSGALATRRPLGRGYVVTVAVDAASKAFQKCDGYKALWQQLCVGKTLHSQPQFRKAAMEYARQVPERAGLRIYPRSTVLTYLLLYFVVAIIGNWVFWSFMKRREMAWVCLVVFSIGFTAFAMIYGSAGRAKAAEIQQVEVLEVPAGGGMGRLRTMVGILTARTSRYTVGLPGDYNLVSDLTQTWLANAPRNAWRSSNSYYFQEGPEPKVGDFVVGASELRVLEVDARVPLTGGVEGTLVRDDFGLRGTLVDATGMDLQGAVLIVQGCAFRLDKKEGTWEVAIPITQIQNHIPAMTTGDVSRLFHHASRSSGPQINQYRELRRTLATRLFMAGDQSQDNQYLDPSIGPYLCAFLEEAGTATVEVTPDVPKHSAETLVLAELIVEHERSDSDAPGQDWLGLPVVEGGQNQNVRRGVGMYGANQAAFALRSRAIGQGIDASILVPSQERLLEAGDLFIDVFVEDKGDGFAAGIAPPHGGGGMMVENLEEQKETEMNGKTFIVSTFRFTDWEDFINKDMGVIQGRVVLARFGPLPPIETLREEWKSNLPQRQEAEKMRKLREEERRAATRAALVAAGKTEDEIARKLAQKKDTRPPKDLTEMPDDEVLLKKWRGRDRKRAERTERELLVRARVKMLNRAKIMGDSEGWR